MLALESGLGSEQQQREFKPLRGEDHNRRVLTGMENVLY